MRYILLVAFLLALSSYAIANDKLVSYDPATSIITVDRSGQLKTYRIKPLTVFTINGEKATFDKLAAGMKLNLTLADPQTVSRIATQVAKVPQANGRTIVLKLRIDGSDTLRVRDGQLTIEHGGWDRPDQITINGVEWKPRWNDKMTAPFEAFNPPLLPFTQAQPRMKQISGRSKVIMDRIPQGQFEKILTLRFDDQDLGSDIYELHITW